MTSTMLSAALDYEKAIDIDEAKKLLNHLRDNQSNIEHKIVAIYNNLTRISGIDSVIGFEAIIEDVEFIEPWNFKVVPAEGDELIEKYNRKVKRLNGMLSKLADNISSHKNLANVIEPLDAKVNGVKYSEEKTDELADSQRMSKELVAKLNGYD